MVCYLLRAENKLLELLAGPRYRPAKDGGWGCRAGCSYNATTLHRHALRRQQLHYLILISPYNRAGRERPNANMATIEAGQNKTAESRLIYR